MRCACRAAAPREREVVEHYGAVGRPGDRRREQRRAGLPVPAPVRQAAVGAARRAAGRRRRGPPHLTAARELQEEAGLAAQDWAVLVDVDTAPGFSDESVRVYLATG